MIDILIQATLSISVESVVESWISVLEHNSSKSRNLGLGAIDAEMMVAINGPAVAHCQGIVKETMDAYWRQCKNVNLSHLAEMSRFTRFVAFWLKCHNLRVFQGTTCLVDIVFCQAPKTILHP